MKKVMILMSVLCCGTMLLTGCARNISANSYDARALDGRGMVSHPCTVVSVRIVNVEEGDYLEDNTTGQALGAIAGGLLGSTIGGGRGQIVAAGVGALAGATAGAFAEKELKSQNAYEYVVRMEDGSLRTVVQGIDTVLRQGQPAYLIEGTNSSRPRLIAR